MSLHVQPIGPIPEATVSSRSRSGSSAAVPSSHPASRPAQPFSLVGPGVLEEAFRRAAFREVATRVVPSPPRLSSAAACVRFEWESFGALHQMLAGVSEADRAAAWDEIEAELRQFEGPNGFEVPCELIVGVGVK